jgi:hypothetical protein
MTRDVPKWRMELPRGGGVLGRMTTRIRRGLTALALVLGVSAVPIAQVAACSCMAMAPGEAATMAEVVFAGTALSEQPGRADPATGMSPVLYTFAVDGVAKGDVGSQISVVAGGDSAMCGTTFGLDERWLVFASTQDGELSTGLCAGNLPLQPDEEPPLSVRAPSAAETEDAAAAGVPMGVLLPIAAVVALAGVSALLFWRGDRLFR